MNNERTERMLGILGDEWDNYVIVCSRYENGQTLYYRQRIGNAYAIQQMLEDEMRDIQMSAFRFYAEEDDGKENQEA